MKNVLRGATQFPLLRYSGGGLGWGLRTKAFSNAITLAEAIFFCIITAANAAGPDPAIIPRPVSLIRGDGFFTLNAQTEIVSENAELAHDLVNMLAPATGCNLTISSTDRPDNVIRLSLNLPNARSDEEYRLISTTHSVIIYAPAPAGLFYGLQTLRQLFHPEIFSPDAIPQKKWTIPCVTILDYPRYRWRGMMLDCSRHFMPPMFIEHFIDLMALHKLNTFHWHLTDDQGWRLEIKKYPMLTFSGSWRKQTVIGPEDSEPKRYDGYGYGGFYTQDDVREIVKFASARFVTIVPEIEMPGHSCAAIAAYPELGCTGKPLDVWCDWGVNPNILNPSEQTIQFYQNVLVEVMQLFPSPFIHLGGDEVPLDQWKSSPRVQARMKKLNLPDEASLQRYMLQRMAEFLHSHGRRLVGWDEILQPDLPSDAVVMSWHGLKAAALAAASGHDAVLAPGSYTYFDHYQSKDVTHEPLAIGGYLPLEKVFSFNPGDNAHLLGAQAQIWTEYIPVPAQVEYMAFPRECALAEVDWSPQDGKSYSDFQARLATHLARLDYLNIHYRALTPNN